MEIPFRELSATALRGVILEFVTRDGTDHTSVENRVATVRKQLECGTATIHFDTDLQTCNVVLRPQDSLPH